LIADCFLSENAQIVHISRRIAPSGAAASIGGSFFQVVTSSSFYVGAGQQWR